MSDEDTLLHAILADSAADTPRLAYADWLDDQPTPLAARKAEFIRLEARVAAAPERGIDRVQFTGRLRLLSLGLDPDWLALVAHPAIESCRLRFRFECPARWDRLTLTPDVRVRHCGACDRSVHFCATLDEAHRHAAAGDCVAVSPALGRRRHDLTPHLAHPVAPPVRLTPEMLDRLRERMTMRIGVADVPPGPTTRDTPDHAPQPKRI